MKMTTWEQAIGTDMPPDQKKQTKLRRAKLSPYKLSENKSDIIFNENSAFNYLLINSFSLGHQVSPIKPLLD
jgi:hypothetical protein